MLMSDKKNTKKAFTLIELLVVIAIIAILAAILFPVFAKVREKARQTACVSNLKQLGTAFLEYSNDYDELYPTAGGYTKDIWDTTNAVDGGSAGNNPTKARANVPLFNPVIDPYLKNRTSSENSVFCCPDLGKDGAQAAGTTGANGVSPNMYQYYPRSYSMNSNLMGRGQAINTFGTTFTINVTDVDLYNVATYSQSACQSGSGAYAGALVPGGSCPQHGYDVTNNLGVGASQAQVTSPANTVMLYEGIPEDTTGLSAASQKYAGNVARSGDFTTADGYYVTGTQCSTAAGSGTTPSGQFLGKGNGYPCQTAGINPAHTGFNNYLYCDGHVKSHTPATYVPGSNFDTTNFRVTEFYLQHCQGNGAPCP